MGGANEISLGPALEHWVERYNCIAFFPLTDLQYCNEGNRKFHLINNGLGNVYVFHCPLLKCSRVDVSPTFRFVVARLS